MAQVHRPLKIGTAVMTWSLLTLLTGQALRPSRLLANAFGIALNDAANAMGVQSLMPVLTSTVLTLDLSAETDGATQLLKGTGNHIITLGQGNDTVQVHDVFTVTSRNRQW